MWWFPALASLLIGNVESEDTNISMVLKKVASRIDLTILQLGHHFTKTPLGILHGKPAINSPREKVSELLLLWPKWIFSKVARELSLGESRFSSHP